MRAFVEELHVADEACFTGTAAEVTPIACVDDYVWPARKPVSALLPDAYARAVAGEDERHPNWVTFAADPAIAR